MVEELPRHVYLTMNGLDADIASSEARIEAFEGAIASERERIAAKTRAIGAWLRAYGMTSIEFEANAKPRAYRLENDRVIPSVGRRGIDPPDAPDEPPFIV